mmetsp:Transcript_880/g.2218  ORF Transcript_880/g.2218 Transcript_880/m.2218 type:complete len:138 (-) Transcript_880:849-1262(-)
MVGGTEDDLIPLKHLIFSLLSVFLLATMWRAVVAFLDMIDSDEDIDIDEALDGVVDFVLAECADRIETIEEEDRREIFRSLLGRPLRPLVLEALLVSPSRRLLDLDLDHTDFVLEKDGESPSQEIPSRNSALRCGSR